MPKYAVFVFEYDIAKLVFQELAQVVCDTINEHHSCKIIQSEEHLWQSFFKYENVIMFGANTVVDVKRIPSNAIIMNFEQLNETSPWFTPEYRSILSKFPVWDYNRLNVDFCKSKLDKYSGKQIQLGYSDRYVIPRELKYPKSTNSSIRMNKIDVLFFGTISQRRCAIYDQLMTTLKGSAIVVFENSCWGSKRDVLIQNSRIILNIHCYESSSYARDAKENKDDVDKMGKCDIADSNKNISKTDQLFEIPRVLPLLCNRKFVITEDSSNMHEYANITEGMVIASYNMIVSSVIKYLQQPQERKRIKNLGYELVKRTKTVLPMNPIS